MQYRKGTIQDIPEITKMIAAAIANMEQQGIHQWDEIYPTADDSERDIKNDTLYTAVQDEKIAAIYVISTECDEEYKLCTWEGSDETAAILHRFCVNPEFQNQGIGKTVLAHIEEQLKALGYDSVRLDVFTENPFALKLYKKAGYQTRGFADWRKGRFLLMEKQLSH